MRANASGALPPAEAAPPLCPGDATPLARKRRSPGNRDVARSGERNGIVRQRAGVELDRLLVAQPDAEPQPRLIVLGDPYEPVAVAHPVAAGTTATLEHTDRTRGLPPSV